VGRHYWWCVMQRHLAGVWGGASLDGAAVVIREGRRKLQPSLRRSTLPDAALKKFGPWQRRATAIGNEITP